MAVPFVVDASLYDMGKWPSTILFCIILCGIHGTPGRRAIDQRKTTRQRLRRRPGAHQRRPGHHLMRERAMSIIRDDTGPITS